MVTNELKNKNDMRDLIFHIKDQFNIVQVRLNILKEYCEAHEYCTDIALGLLLNDIECQYDFLNKLFDKFNF